VRKAFVFRLYPTRQQTAALVRMLAAHRRLYNAALEHRRWAYRQARVSVHYGQQSAELRGIRQDDPDLAACNFSSLQATLRQLDRSFQAFFRRLRTGQAPGYPRFKGRDRFHTVTFPALGDGCAIRGTRLYLQAVGDIKLKLHRPLVGHIKTVAVTCRADGWYAVFSCDLGDAAPEPSTHPPVGIDLGLHSFLATSDGETVAAPQYLRQAQATLRRAQRHLGRCQRGSKRRAKARQRVARLHRRVANSRRDFHHKTARSLVGRYGVVVVEDLNVAGIARSRLAKSAHDAAWGQFLLILGHKAEEAGVTVVSVNPHHTTQACSGCGALVPKGLAVRVHRCPACGFVADRDVNAAVNIKRLGLSRQAPTRAVAGVA